jgi:hypothetical protein
MSLDVIKVHDKVEFHRTGDPFLENQKGVVLGKYENSLFRYKCSIVLLDNKVEGCDPALVIADLCLRIVQD